MEIKLHKKLERHLDRTNKKVRDKFMERLILFSVNPYHPILNNHKLTGRYKGLSSINISGDIRAVFHYNSKTDTAIFVKLDTHSKLYS